MPEDTANKRYQHAEVASLRAALADLQEKNRQLEAALAQARGGEPVEPAPSLGAEALQEALRQGEEKFRLAFWTNPDPCCITRARDGAFIEINPGFETVSGYSRQEILASTSLALNLYPDSEVRQRLVEDVSAHGQVRGREVMFRTKSGRLVHTLMSLSVFRLNGEPHILSNVKVVDDLKAAQRDLAQSEERYRLIVETANEGIWGVDAQGSTTLVNRRLAGMLGYEPWEMLGQPVEAFVHPDELTDFHGQMTMRQRGLGDHFERRYRHKKGHYVQALVGATPVLDHEGRYTGSFAMITDISERKRAEEEIRRLNHSLEQQVAERTASLAATVAELQREMSRREQVQADLLASQTKLRSVVEGTPAFVMILDTEGRITFVNRLMTGQKTEDTIGASLAGFAHPDHRQAVLAALAQAVASGEVVRLEAMGPSPHGAHSWYDVSFSPVLLDGQVRQVVFTALDIEERKQAREALRQSEERYRLLVESANEGIVVAQDGMVKFFNQRMLELTGMTAEEYTTRPFIEHVHPEDRPKVMAKHLARLQGETSPNTDTFRIVDKQGRVKWIQPNGVLIHWEGRPATLGFFTDITQRMQAEEDLRQSEEKFSVAFRNSPALMALTVLEDGTYLDVNDKFLELLGKTREEVIGRRSTEIGWLRPEDRRMVMETLQSQGRVAGLDLTSYKPDGSPVPCSYHCQMVQIGGQRRLLTIALDMSQQKAALEALRQSEERYRLLSENAQDIIVLRDNQMRGLYVSPSVKRVLGYEPQEFLDTPLMDLLHPDDTEVVTNEALASLEQVEGGVYAQNRVRRKDGSYVWLEVLTGPVFDAQGGLAGHLAAARDISQRRRAEDALLHLAAGVAHNFNNVLMASLSNAQAAQGLLARGQADPERLGELLENVAQAALNGRDVVHRLSRFVSGRQEHTSSVELVDLGQLLAALPGLVQGMTAPGRAGLDLRSQEGLMVKGVPGELMEVFLNLAKNAIEAMPQGGELKVSARAEGQMAVIEFCDSGLGADQATLARFFEPFFSTKGAQGQGLGLSVSLAIARSHGGDISARSQPGQGTTLTVRLPLGQPATVKEPALGRPAPAGPLKILLVEDEGLVAMGMTLTLESAGHQVLHVVTMAGALAIMEQFRPHLAVCDLGLPDATGWEVCARLERQARELGLKHLPLVVLSGWGREQLGSLPPGAPQPFAYLQKPVERNRLLEVIAKAGWQAPS